MKHNNKKFNKKGKREGSEMEEREFNSKNPRKKMRDNTPETPPVIVPPKDAGNVTPPENSVQTQFYAAKSFRDLSWKSNIMVSVDPNTEVSRSADPYAILNRTNQVLVASYPGRSNTSGNVVAQLARGSNSTFQNVADYMRQWIKLNYNFLKLTEDSNAPISNNDQMNNIYLEVQSKFQSESYYSIPFFSWEVTGTTFFTDTTLDIVNYYQTFIQAGLQVALAYRKTLSLEKHLKDMLFFKGAAVAERMFGLLKKSSFKAAVETVTKGLASNFIDAKWYSQVSEAVSTPSRKSNSMIDPLIELIPEYFHNDTLEVKIDEVLLFKTADMASFFTNVNEFVKNISAYEILEQSRNAGSDYNPNTWFNALVANLNVIISQINVFNDNFADMNVAFNGMERVQLTDWKKGITVEIDFINSDYEVKFNVLVEDIITSIYSGSKTITYDTKIYKWRFFDVWDKYLGVPRYDIISGGAFLSFSAKNIEKPDGTPENILYPVLFEPGESEMLTRSGNTHEITRVREKLNTSSELSRLLSLSNLDELEVQLPRVVTTSISNVKEKSWIANVLLTVVGWYSNLNGGTTERGVTPDAMCLIDIEQEDITNDMMDHYRQNSPFKVVQTTEIPKVGFIRTAIITNRK